MAEKLTQQQREAVENRGGQLLVSAAAGSGKTKVLVDRLMRYLTDPVAPANLDDFLIITYTKAAASELRGKIAQKLSQKIAEQPDNRHLQQQIQRLYLAKISTVHSFCRDILRENAYRADISADFRVADENECTQLQLQALDQVLNDAYAQLENNSEFRALIDTQGFGRDDRSIPQILLKVYHSAKCHLDPDGWLDWCATQSKAENVEDAAQTVWGQYLLQDLQCYLDLNIQALENCAKRAADNDTMEKVSALLWQTVEQLKSLRNCNLWDQVVNHGKIDFGRLTFSKKCTDMHLAEQIKAIREACKSGLAGKLRSFSDPSEQILRDLRATSPSTCGLIGLVRAFSRQYDKLKSNRRVLDFSDLEHKTLDLLLGKNRSGVTAVAKEIESRFREVMVDEYQDSNKVQDAIFGALTSRRNNCFMVGDVKQSIYQFRLADPGIFIEKYNTFEPAAVAVDGQGRKIQLSKNFRSSSGVIQAVNDVFQSCMSQRVGGLEYTADEMLYEGIPHSPLGETEVELYGVQVREDTYAEEAAFVAERISQLLNGQHMIRQEDELRPIKPEDIVILLRSPGSVGGEFQYALRARGIACSTGDSTDLLQTEEVGVLISLLQVIVNPQQDIPLLSVLSNRVFAFTADELAQIRSQNKQCSMYDALRMCDSPKAIAFLNLLQRFRSQVKRLRLTQLIEMVLLETQLMSTFMALPDAQEKYSNLQAFLQVVSDFAAGGQRDVIQFLEYAQQMEERGLSVSGEQTHSGAVTIMSIHKSKGLEFPVVFLCGLSRSFNKESAREQVLCHKELGLGLGFVDLAQRVRYPTIAKRAIAVKILEESISEELRVLYVGMTRPKDRLIMTYARRNLENDLQDLAMRLEMTPKELLTGQVDCPGQWVLQTALRKTETGSFFQLAGNPGCAQLSEIPWLIRTVEGTILEDSNISKKAEAACASDALIRKMGHSLNFAYAHIPATTTPSKRTATQLKGRVKDQEIAEYTHRHFAPTFRKPSFVKQEKSSVAYGIATHTFMQYATFSICTSEAAVIQEIKRLQAAKLLADEQAKLLDASSIAAFFATELGRKISHSQNVKREFKFSILVDAQAYFPEVEGEEILLQGVVDCALLEADGITVVDFKTDRVTPQTMIETANKYKGQVEAYRFALEKIYGLPVKSACLYFVRAKEFVYM